MSVWILRQKLTLEQEKNLAQQEMLTLPFDGLPDLSGVMDFEWMKQLLMRLNPGQAPESVARQADRYWHIKSNLMEEDLILVPYEHMAGVALAEVLDRYVTYVEDGKDIHKIRVRWMNTNIPRWRLRALKPMLNDTTIPMQMVSHHADRKVVFGFSDRNSNIFGKWQFLLAGFIIFQEIVMLIHLVFHR